MANKVSVAADFPFLWVSVSRSVWKFADSLLG